MVMFKTSPETLKFINFINDHKLRPRKKCIICEKKIKRRKGKAAGARTRPSRSKKAITCSKKCAKIYNRISTKIYRRDYDKIKKLKNKIKKLKKKEE